ncbi:hypothetical protein ACHQM5_030442 [Ranunculus cassubicifolius]
MQDAGDDIVSKKCTATKTNTLSQKKNVRKISHLRKWKRKSTSPFNKAIGSVLSKRKASQISTNGSPNKRLKGKATQRRHTLQKVDDDDNSSPEKPLSLMFQGVKSLKKRHRHESVTDRDVRQQKVRRRRKRHKRENVVELDETERLQRRTRYLVIKMKQEQNLIEAYSGEGWKGQSREKIRPEKELQRAKKQILKCKLGIRDVIRQLEARSSEGCIEESAISPDGSVFHEHIFCSKCKLRDAFPDDDIILCDGTCNSAFHQKCLEPPLATENIPPDDQGWYCKFCECKMEILEGIDAHLGTRFSPNSKWQDIFLEAAIECDHEDTSLYPEGDWPSDDSEDDDYDPERIEKMSSYTVMGSEENTTDDASSSSSLDWTSGDDDLCSGRLVSDRILEGIPDDPDGSTDHIVYRRRHHGDVDYKKLHDEMFGKDMPESEEISEDEEWGPHRPKSRRKESENGIPEVTPVNGENKKRNSSIHENKRKLFRIPPDAVKKLREVFAKNELPSRDVRENLSKQLGIPLEKINKWFKNARYMALKIRKANGTADPAGSSDNIQIPDVDSKVSGSLEIANQRHKKSRKRKNSRLITPARKLLRNKKSAPSSVIKEEPPCPYMAEMERICRVEDRIQRMKELVSFGNEKIVNERCVVYVPVAVLKEKTT